MRAYVLPLLVSEVPSILRKFFLIEVTLEATILKLSWQPGYAYVCICLYAYVCRVISTQNWLEGEKPSTDSASFTKSAKSIFPSDYILPITIFNDFILEFGVCLAQNNMAQEQP